MLSIVFADPADSPGACDKVYGKRIVTCPHFLLRYGCVKSADVTESITMHAYFFAYVPDFHHEVSCKCL